MSKNTLFLTFLTQVSHSLHKWTREWAFDISFFIFQLNKGLYQFLSLCEFFQCLIVFTYFESTITIKVKAWSWPWSLIVKFVQLIFSRTVCLQIVSERKCSVWQFYFSKIWRDFFPFFSLFIIYYSCRFARYKLN